MKITEVRTHVCDAYRTNWVFVQVLTDQGIEGVGEATLEYKENAVCGAITDLSRMLIGRDPHEIEAIWHDAYRDAYWRGGPVLMSALGGVEMALWDLKGKDLNVPVYQLLGGRVRDRVRCYANGWFAPAKRPDEFAAKAKEAVARGFAALKWDPFGSAYRSISGLQLREAIACIAAVREAVGDEVDLLIEAHGRFDVPSAVRIGQAIAAFRPLWFEEPIPPDNLDALADVRRRVPVAVAAGKRLYSRWDYRAFFEARCADFAQPDITHVGGLGELRRTAAVAETHHVPLCPHNPSGPVANAVSLQMAACCPNFEFLETMSLDVPWRRDVAHEYSALSNGFVSIPDRPGLGVELNLDAVAEHPFQPHDLRHYRRNLTDIRPLDAAAVGMPVPSHMRGRGAG